VMSPAGQQLRHTLLQRLFDLLHTEGADRRISPALFKLDKGKRLVSDLLPLWTGGPHVRTVVVAFVSQLPDYVQQSTNPAPVPVHAFSKELAGAPKQMAAEEVAALLEAVTAHGSTVLRAALQLSEVCALLFGLLCHAAPAQGPRNLGALGAFYGLLMSLATTCQPAWAVLNAVLPTTDAMHAAMLADLIGQLPVDTMATACQKAKEAFDVKLQMHEPRPAPEQ